MAIDNIDTTDNLNTGRVKLNQAIDQANTVQGQLDTIILVSETSSAETIQARGGEPLLYNRLDKVDTQLAETMNQIRNMSIPVLDTDPITPANGQIWLLKYYELLRDTFTGADGSTLDVSTWDVVKLKTTGSTATHAATNKIDIRGNRCQFNVGAAETIADGGKLEMLARMKKFQIDWTLESRTITWKQQPYQGLGTWGMVLSQALAIDNGNVLANYAIRVVFGVANTSLQMANPDVGIVYNQNFAHGKTGDLISEFKLVIDPATANVTLHQDGVQKLQAVAPNIIVTSGWLYAYCQVNSTTATVRDIDDIVIE